MSEARHVMILASAGSGKTYALTDRFIGLLGAGARPERIVALTFTRKAAGEFFDEILGKLARAAADPAAAAKLATGIGRPAFGRADFLRLLREMVDAMPRLRLGTLDSFFARIARAFPLELGLAGDFEILQEHAARLERRRVLRRMFGRAGALSDGQREFIEAFKRATFGREEKRLGAQLDAFLDQHQEIYLAAPEAEKWGDPGRIWPAGSRWLVAPVDAVAAARKLRAWVAAAGLPDKQRQRWEDFLAALEGWVPGAQLPGKVEYVLKKALEQWANLPTGRAVLAFDRLKQALDPATGAALADLAKHVIGGELRRRIEVTRGLHAVLRSYEHTYHDAVRRAGRLTFADVQRLLAPAAGAPVLSGAADAPDRLYIDYRLDAETDHWLLDEFQDTSFGQWSILGNLIDEAVQDPAGNRSFFCVGDVKQAIFTWREGDPRLFGEIFNHYNAATPGAVAAKHLDTSWRSGPPLLELVNQVCGNAPVLARLFPGELSAAWNAVWRTHVAARPEQTGQAAWLSAAGADGRRATTLALLRELRPLERGLSCAVLVQKNTQAVQMAEYLRQAGGLPAVAESDLSVCIDNPLGSALLALVRAAAHPGDTLALEHVRMTPLGAALQTAGIETRDALTERVLGSIHETGFERTLAHWAQLLEPTLAPDDIFSRERARRLVDAARQFDETGSRDAAEFLEFMERHTVREPEGAAVVRVMTIHKSKGLGFDVVVLPELQGQSLDQARDGLAVHKADDRSVQWVLDPPAKAIVQSDPVLDAHLRTAEAEAGYEALSLLYVALTRAKRGLYVVTDPVGKTTSRNFPRLLAETLGTQELEVAVGRLRLPGCWAMGDPGWHESIAGTRPAPSLEDCQVTAEPAGIPRLAAVRPSGGSEGAVAAGTLFTLEQGGRGFGEEVHRWLAEVEWIGTAETAESWLSRCERTEVRDAVMAALRAPGLTEVWAKPGVHAEVWRERAFEVVLDGKWVSGKFDRVVVERDEGTRPVRAAVYDFKTDQCPPDSDFVRLARRHARQLAIYRRAVCALTGLDPAAIRCEVVFVRMGRKLATETPA